MLYILGSGGSIPYEGLGINNETINGIEDRPWREGQHICSIYGILKICVPGIRNRHLASSVYIDPQTPVNIRKENM
jgi:hypothetical protein